LRTGTIGAAILALALFSTRPAFSQTSGNSAAATSDNPKASGIPRLADGHPDLQGLWHNESGYQVAMAHVRGASNLAVALGDFHSPGVPLPLPYLPDLEKIRDYRNLHDPYHDPEAHCHVPGVPREIEQPTSLFPVQITQDEKNVALLFEYTHDVRIIPEDGSSHPKHYWTWDGDSRGHWEGNALVADVTSFSDTTWLDAAGDYHSDKLHVTERYTRSSPDTLTYEATIEDPMVFTRPWKIRMPLRLQKGVQILEDECEEGDNGRRHHIPLFRQTP